MDFSDLWMKMQIYVINVFGSNILSFMQKFSSFFCDNFTEFCDFEIYFEFL